MTLETILSVAMLGVLIWAVRFNLPRAIREKDGLALAAALLTILLALAGWALIGVGVRSDPIHDAPGDRSPLVSTSALDSRGPYVSGLNTGLSISLRSW